MMEGSHKLDARILDVIIVGGGLSGLVLAREVHRLGSNVRWLLMEARSTLGGRLKNDDSDSDIDLGGAWIWPQVQPGMRKLVDELSIATFPQPDDDSDGSMRMVGGAVQLITQLSASLPLGNIMLDSPVKSCVLLSPNTDNAMVEVRTLSDEIFLARKVVLAAPPKMILKHIRFNPRLSQPKQLAMELCPTWMAAVTKVSLVYKIRYWDKDDSNCGLRGTPAFQMYDASTQDGKVTALTFFTLIPSNTPYAQDDELLAHQVAEQISSLWARLGREIVAQQAKTYTVYHVQRWPMDPYISDDPNPPRVIQHPTPDLILSKVEWNGLLHFAGSETDQNSPGVMEGAVGAAMRVARELAEWWPGVHGEAHEGLK
jgi:monoamine oxidase